MVAPRRLCRFVPTGRPPSESRRGAPPTAADASLLSRDVGRGGGGCARAPRQTLPASQEGQTGPRTRCASREGGTSADCGPTRFRRVVGPGGDPLRGGDGAPLRGRWDGSRSATALRVECIRGGARRRGGLCRRRPSAHRTQPAARPNIGLLLTLLELLDVVDAFVCGTTCLPLSTCPHHHPLPHYQPFLFPLPSNRHEALLWRSIRPAALDGLY